MRLVNLSSLLLLTACGTFVPNLKVFQVSSADGVNLVRGIAQSIECELRRAVVEVIDLDKRVAALNQGIRSAPWLDSWGVQVNLTLTIIENSGITPGVQAASPSVSDPSDVSVVGSGPFTAKATRRGALNYYYLISDLYRMSLCTQETVASLPSGSRLIRSDLKIGEWLQAQALAAGTGAIPVSKEPNAVTQTIEFAATYGGSLNLNAPEISSKISAITLAASASRSRTHAVTMTFGPANESKTGLSGSAADAFLAAQIGAEVRFAQ